MSSKIVFSSTTPPLGPLVVVRKEGQLCCSIRINRHISPTPTIDPLTVPLQRLPTNRGRPHVYGPRLGSTIYPNIPSPLLKIAHSLPTFYSLQIYRSSFSLNEPNDVVALSNFTCVASCSPTVTVPEYQCCGLVSALVILPHIILYLASCSAHKVGRSIRALSSHVHYPVV